MRTTPRKVKIQSSLKELELPVRMKMHHKSQMMLNRIISARFIVSLFTWMVHSGAQHTHLE